MDFSLNWLAIGVVTLGHFILGAVWFSAIFGKAWMRIHHGDKIPTKAELDKMGEGMWKLMISEFIATALLTVGVACLVAAIPSMDGIRIGFMVWLAFILPMIVSNTLWGNDKKPLMVQKITISATYRLIALIATGYVLSIW